MQTGHEEKEFTVFHARHATTFAGQENTSRSGQFNTARSETTKTSSLSMSVSTHTSASASPSKLLRTTAIGMSGRRSASGALLLDCRSRQRGGRGRDAGHVSQHDVLMIVLSILEYQRPFGTTAAAPLS